MDIIDCKNCATPIKLPIIPEPVHCGKPMTLNEETQQWECWMGPNCGKQDVLYDCKI